VALVWFGWQSYLAKKYPQAEKPATPATEVKPEEPSNVSKAAVTKAVEASQKENSEKIIESVPEQTLSYENEQLSFLVSSRGMGLKNLILKNHLDRKHRPMQLGADESGFLYQAGLVGSSRALNFKIEKRSDNIFLGTAQVGATKISR